MTYTSRDGNDIWWERFGDGDEAVLLAMGHAWDARMWHRVVSALAPRYSVVVFDNRGVGRTRWDGLPFTIEDLAQDGLAALDAAGFARAHVYGASMGGLTAQEIALRAPERVRSLVLGCTGTLSPDLPTPEPPARTPWKARIPRRLQLLVLRKVMYGAGTPKAAIREDLRILRRTPARREGLLAQGVAVAGYRSRERLADLRVPTLVMHGDADKVVPFAMGEELASLIPGARFVALPGEGHVYMTAVDGPANRAVLDFLTELG